MDETISKRAGTDAPLTIAVIEGTSRVQRQSIKVSRYITDYINSRDDAQAILVDPIDFDMPGDGNDPEGKDPRYSAITEKADAFFIVVPEYNHSFPGSLKRLLDSELENYNHKPVAFAGVSSGAWGGTRAVESLVPAVRETGLVAMSWDIFFPRVQDMFDEDGNLMKEHQERYRKHTAKLLDELVWFADMLRNARNR